MPPPKTMSMKGVTSRKVSSVDTFQQFGLAFPAGATIMANVVSTSTCGCGPMMIMVWQGDITQWGKVYRPRDVHAREIFASGWLAERWWDHMLLVSGVGSGLSCECSFERSGYWQYAYSLGRHVADASLWSAIVCILTLFQIEMTEELGNVKWTTGLSMYVTFSWRGAYHWCGLSRHPFLFPYQFILRDKEMNSQKFASLIYASQIAL